MWEEAQGAQTDGERARSPQPRTSPCIPTFSPHSSSGCAPPSPAGCRGWAGVRRGGARCAGVVAPLIPPHGPPRAAGRFPLASSSPAL